MSKKNIVRKMFVLLIISLISIFDVSAYNEEVISVGCSDWKPYVYQKEGELDGSVYQIVKAVFERAQIPFTFDILPWARAYSSGIKNKNYLVACLGRTPEREENFHWIGPVSLGINVYFYKLKSNPLQVANIEEAKKQSIGLVRNSYSQEYINRNKFSEDNLSYVVHSKQLLKMLTFGRYELTLLEEDGLSLLAGQVNLPAEHFEKALFAFSVVDHLAFSKNTSQEIISRVKNAYQQLADEGKITELIQQYNRL